MSPRVSLEVLVESLHTTEPIRGEDSLCTHRPRAPRSTPFAVFQFSKHTEEVGGPLPHWVQLGVTDIGALIIIEDKEAIACIHLFLQWCPLRFGQVFPGAQRQAIGHCDGSAHSQPPRPPRATYLPLGALRTRLGT